MRPRRRRELAARALPGVPLHDPADAPGTRCALALGVDALNGLDRRQAEQLIGRTRIYAAPHLPLVAHAGCALDEAGFRALGFVPGPTDPAENIRLHDYGIGTRKTVPDWLNCHFWAHPER